MIVRITTSPLSPSIHFYWQFISYVGEGECLMCKIKKGPTLLQSLINIRFPATLSKVVVRKEKEENDKIVSPIFSKVIYSQIYKKVAPLSLYSNKCPPPFHACLCRYSYSAPRTQALSCWEVQIEVWQHIYVVLLNIEINRLTKYLV